MRGDGSGGWVSSQEGVRYRGPDPQPEWSLKFDGLATASAVLRGLVPPIRPLLELHMRDTAITRGGDGNYYMTGSTGDNVFLFNDGVELWRSRDLSAWQYLGLVWSIEDDGTWQRAWRRVNGKLLRAVLAPRLHYIKGNYYLCLTIAPSGIALLKSRSRKPEGPYVPALAVDRPLADGTFGTLFEDADGAVYFTYGGGGAIARMKYDLSDFAEPYRRIELQDPDRDPSHHAGQCESRGLNDIGYEGVFLFRSGDRYYLGAADSYQGRYSAMAAISDKLYGPYRKRHEAVPGGGGTTFFQDAYGNWWSGYFGNDPQAPFREKPAIVLLEFDGDGMIHVAKGGGR